MASGKAWNRRLALAGGAALAAGGGYLAFHPRAGGVHPVADARTLRRGNASEPQTLDNSLSVAVYDDAIIGDMTIGLTTEDTLANPIPGMAMRWTTSADGLTWTFTLRQALWSDGKPVTAQDFVFSWQRLLDPRTAAPYGYFLYIVKNAEPINAGKLPAAELGARALDDHTLEVRLEHPAPYLLQMLTHAMWCRPRARTGPGRKTMSATAPSA